MAPTFAAIRLEDISAPRCFAIEERIQARVALEQGLNRHDLTGYFD